jgi:hypothetical protein
LTNYAYSSHYLPIDIVPGEPWPADTPNEDTIDPQKSDLTCTPDLSKKMSHREEIGLENSEGKVYGEATELYNKYQKYLE